MTDYQNTMPLLLRNYQHIQSWLLYGGDCETKCVFSFTDAILGHDSKSHPDLLYLQRDNILVDDIRSLIDFLHKTSFENNYRIAVIDSVASMNNNAQHAILKVLEQPPKKTLIVLMNDNLHAVMPTIRSRCYKLYVGGGDHIEQISADLYKEILQCFKRSTAPQISDQNTFEHILSLLQTLILRLLKIKLGCQVVEELYQGEFLELRSFDNCITSLYKKWEKILQFRINKLHLSKQQIIILLFESAL